MKPDDFVKLATEFSNASKRVALVLQNARSNTSSRRSRDLLKSLSLDLVKFSHGSLAVVTLFECSERQTMIEECDLGEQAYRELLNGINEVVDDNDALPQGYDLGVLLKIRDIGKILNRGVSRIDFTLNHRTKPVRATFNKETFQRVRARIEKPEPQKVTIQGRLLMADFKEPEHRLRVHPSVGEPVNCLFSDGLSDKIEENIRQFVRVTGSTKYNAQGEVTRINISDIENIEETEAVDEVSNRTVHLTRCILESRLTRRIIGRSGAYACIEFRCLAGRVA